MKKAMILAAAASVLLPIFVYAQNGPSRNRNLLAIVKNGRYGYINHQGRVVIRPQFHWGEDFEDGFARVYICSHMVSINESGKVVPLRWVTGNRLGPRRVSGKVGFVDVSGKIKIDAVYEDALLFSDGLAAVEVNGLWGFIDPSGREVIPPQFKSAYYFHEGVGIAETDSGIVLIDKTGAVIASGYEYLSGITEEGRVPVSRDDKYGYLDLKGKIAIPLEYDFADSFSRGLALVKMGMKWGYIDRDGHTRIPFIFDKAGPFASGLAPAQIAGESGFIDKSGRFAFHLAFEYAPGFLTGNDEGLFVADSDVSRFWTSDGKFGYINTSGIVIWGPAPEVPDHAPLFGWSEQDKIESCRGIPRAIRKAVAQLPED